MTRKLTLNLGVRWNLEGPPSELRNRILSDFDTTSANPVQTSVPANLLPAGTVLMGGNTCAGVNGKPTGARHSMRWNCTLLFATHSWRTHSSDSPS